MAGDEGFEPPNGGTRTHCLTTWRIPIGIFIISHFFKNISIIFLKSLYKIRKPSYTPIDSLVSDYFLWKEQMANITRIKAGESRDTKEKTSPKSPTPKTTNSKSVTETTSHTQHTKVSKVDKKLTKLEKAQQKYEKKQAKKQAKLAKKANKKPMPKVLRISTAPFRKIGSYFHASWQELRQVRWPNRKMTWKLVSAVIVYTVIFAAFIMLLDAGFTLLFNNLLK